MIDVFQALLALLENQQQFSVDVGFYCSFTCLITGETVVLRLSASNAVNQIVEERVNPTFQFFSHLWSGVKEKSG